MFPTKNDYITALIETKIA